LLSTTTVTWPRGESVTAGFPGGEISPLAAGPHRHRR
jgi:hypothetical protein